MNSAAQTCSIPARAWAGRLFVGNSRPAQASLKSVQVRLQRFSAAAVAVGALPVETMGQRAVPPETNEKQQLDLLMEKLDSRKAEWAALPIGEKVALLKEIRARILHEPVAWVRASAQGVKREPSEDALAGELIATVATTTGLIDGYITTLTSLERTGAPPRLPTRTTPSGQTVVKTFPWGFWQSKTDPLGLAGATAELYLDPSREPSQGRFFGTGKHDGKVCVTLGAGNQQFLALGDVLHQMISEGCVCLLKYHPIQAPVAPYIDYVLEPLAKRGFFASALCDLPATQHLLYHPLTDCICMTGGNATHDAIVWGSGKEEQEQRKAKDDPLLKVPIHSELGCVTPWLVVPGPWTEAEIEHHAKALAQAVLNNCSCNCLAAKVVLLPEGWELGDALISKFKQELGKFALPNPYYPGIRERYSAFQQRYPSAEAVAAPPEDPTKPCGEPLPVLVNVLSAYPANPAQEYAFQTEPFAPVVTFVKVPCQANGKSLEESFLEAAVRAANKDLWGTLSCTLLVHPKTEERYGQAVQAALDELRYGSVCVNMWSVVGYMTMAGHWGGFQGGQTLKDVQSGMGGVHNTLLFDHPQKQVIKTPFISALHPMPPYASKLPLGVAKVVAGLSHSGLLGILRMLLWAK